MFILVCIVCCVIFADSAPTITPNHHDMTDFFSRQLPWTLIISGQVGSKPKMPRRMQSTACQDKLFVAWTAHAGTTKNMQYPDANMWNELSVGYITEFSVNGGVTTLVNDYKMDWCNEMGGIEASEDCSIVTVLCKSDKTPTQAPGPTVINFIENTKNAEGDYPFGWYVESQPDINKDGYRIVDYMYLLEYTGGGLANSPNTQVLVGKNIGGWNYGHWEVSLNAALTKYYVSLKTTIGSAETGWHEGETSFTILREDWSKINSAWACGTGHIQANRVTYNKELDMWARFCWTDYNYEQNAPNAMFYSTMPGTGKAAQLRSIQEREGANWNGNGGSMNMVSLKQNGFLGTAVGPGGNGNPITVGVIKVPGGQENVDGYIHNFVWLNLPDTTEDTIIPVDNDNRIGFANLQRIGLENDNRFLLGWATGVAFQGIPKKYFVTEIDESGCRLGSATEMSASGWGEDNVWTRIPNSGCIAMPYVWLGETPTGKYGDCGECTDTNAAFSQRLRITVVCPGAKSSEKVCDFVDNADPLPSCTDSLQNGDEEGVDCGGSRCTICPVLNEGGECWNGGCRAGGPCPSKCGSGHCCRTGFNDEGCGDLGCSFHCCTDVSSLTPPTPTPSPTTPPTTASPTVPPTPSPTTSTLSPTLSPTPTPQCPQEGVWDATDPRSTATKSCPSGSSGTHTRKCNKKGKWQSAINTCVPVPTCDDDSQNGDETGIDCGGSCTTTCAFCDGVTCTFGVCNEIKETCDCNEGYTGDRCQSQEATLCDGVQCGNQGSCDENTGLCVCINGYSGNLCDVAPSCTDGIKNGQETGVDCGATCTACTTHSWDLGLYGECSVTCGVGIQTRRVTCIDPDNRPVEDLLCKDSAIHKPVTEVACNSGQCAVYTWTVDSWQGCSRTCGGGTEIRDVDCLSDASEPPSKVSSTNCDCDIGETDMFDCTEIPSSVRSCNPDECTENNWVANTYGPCNSECGGGTQTRDVACYSANGVITNSTNCKLNPKPSISRSCNTDLCQTYLWDSCGWEECTASCGGGIGMIGVQHREVFCKSLLFNTRVDNSLCDTATRPVTISANCGTQACTDNNWMASGPWSSCVNGLKTRAFHCHLADGQNAAELACAQVPLPLSKMTCSPDQCHIPELVEPSSSHSRCHTMLTFFVFAPIFIWIDTVL